MSRTEAFRAGHAQPVPVAAQGAMRYAAQMGNQRLATYRGVVTTPQMQQSMATAYKALPEFDPQAVPAFKAMRDETARQFDYMTRSPRKGGLGIDVHVQDEDPYSGPRELLQDIHNRNRLGVLSTASTGEHPIFSNDENDQFRAVHDFFGHAGTGRGFDRHGEEAAFQSHASMYSPLARRALATETRGQNAALIVGKNGFAPQKVALLPRRFGDPSLSFGDREAAMRQALHFSQQQFGRK